MVEYYVRSLEHYSEHKVSLNKLLRKGQAWEWGKEQEAAFDTLKEVLTTAQVLACPDFSNPFTIQCDASGKP